MKKYIISIGLLILSWAIVWGALYKYENGLPNGAITEFSKTVFADLNNIKIVKNIEKDNLFYVYENEIKLFQVLALKENNNWKISLNEKYIEPIHIYVPENSSVYVNGELLNAENIVNYKLENRYLLLDDEKLLPDLECYEINNYALVPQITVINNNKECELEVKDRTVKANLFLTEEQREEFKSILATTAKLYARYITNDANFSELSNYLYKNTDFYKELKSFYNDWYVHSGYEFRNEEIIDIKQTSNTSFEGEISFEYILKKGMKEFSFPSNYKIYFINTGDSWKAICVDTK